MPKALRKLSKSKRVSTDKDFVVVLVTCPTRRLASGMASKLVKEGLAACINIVPSVWSIYRWQGKIEKSREALLLIKTSRHSFRRLCRKISALHPYEVPEVLALPIAAGSPPYLRWLSQSVSKVYR